MWRCVSVCVCVFAKVRPSVNNRDSHQYSGVILIVLFFVVAQDVLRM